jgi:hypothetical protein
LRELVV